MSISVIMSAFNEVKFVDKSITSILKQSYHDFEFLVIDDFSNDGTLEKLKFYQSTDDRIKLFTNSERKGLSKNLNFLINKSKYEYLARVDADDIYDHKRFELQKDFLDKNKDIEILGTDAYVIDDKSNIIGHIEKSIYNRIIKETIYLQNPLIHSSVMMRKSKLLSDKYFFYNIEYDRIQDYELWIRKFNNSNIFSLEKKLTQYRNKNKNNIKLLFKDMYYGNKVRVKNINNYKQLLSGLLIFNLQKLMTILKSLFFR